MIYIKPQNTATLQINVTATAGQYGVSFESLLEGTVGTVIELLPGDKLEIIVQDDLTGLLSLKVLFYGHLL